MDTSNPALNIMAITVSKVNIKSYYIVNLLTYSMEQSPS